MPFLAYGRANTQDCWPGLVRWRGFPCRSPVSRWLVAHVPSWLLLVGLIAVIAGGAVLIGWGLRKRFPTLAEEDHVEQCARAGIRQT